MALGSFLQALLGMLQYLLGLLLARTRPAQKATRVLGCLATAAAAVLCVLRTILAWIDRCVVAGFPFCRVVTPDI